ncbi:ABC transporter substrate-binding protein [Pelomonas cellulosilytica]|uniref:ABC transporter substrate-binding protein n=1 Tax=Pelomonas cellulosilytica TaxID=2906762 RepID=A0ABS8XKZ2_9BURK|nr:ABC transporter substrate-binding protein [Pelomonas sp. P8]MCE4553496.1 ABC transporter substrate-binding protein [Pelomonas sp. P8]
MKKWGAAMLALIALSATAEDIVIGQSVALSGPTADIGRDMRDGALAVFARANASNALGRPIQLITLDNANDRKRATENTQLLLDKHKALALFGYSSATASLDALPLVGKQHMLFFAPFSGAMDIRNHPSVYTVRASYQDEAAKIIASKREVGAVKSVVLYYDDEVGRSNHDAVVAAFASAGLAKPQGVAIKRGAPLDRAGVTALLKDAPHYVFVTTQHPPVADYLRISNEIGNNVPVAALSFVNPDELAEGVGGAARGTVVAQVMPSPTAASHASRPVVKECADALRALNGAALNYTSLESCIAAKALVVALKKAGPKVTRESLLSTMGTLGHVDLNGFTLNYAGGNRHGSNWVDLAILSRGNRFVH